MKTFITQMLALVMGLFSGAVCAHPHSTPVRAQLMIEDSDHASNNSGGYGYIASSEAEAYASFQFSCSTPELNRYYECGSGGLIHPWGDERETLMSSVRTTFQALVLQRLREQMAEKLIIEHAALTVSPRTDWPTALPTCLQSAEERRGRYATTDAKRTELSSLHRSLPAGMTPLNSIGAMPAAQRLRVNKFNAVINANSRGNLLRSVMLHDQLKSRRDTICRQSGTWAVNNCADLRNQMDRIEDSYPALYGGDGQAVPANHLDQLHNAIYDVMGAASSGNDAARRTRGRALYRAHTGIPSGNYSSDEYKDFEAAVSSKVAAAHTASLVAASSRTATQRHQADALDSLNGKIAQLQTSYRDSLQARMDGICAPSPGMQLTDFVNNQPNVLRQMMADATPADRDALRMVLCANNLQTTLAPRPQCRGTSAAHTAAGDVVTVNRTSSSWPYGSSNQYTITYPNSPAGAAPTIRMEINFPTSIRPREAAQRFLNNFKSNVEGYYNCTAGNRPPATFGPVTSGCLDSSDPSCTPDQIETMPARSCPPHPGMAPMKFEFNFTPRYLCQSGETPDHDHCIANSARVAEPRMVLHQCYNADMSGADGTNCAKVKTFAIAKCQERTQRIIASGGRMVVNEAASEFDDFLSNIVNPFNPTTPIAATSGSRCNTDPANPIDNSAADISICNGLSESQTVGSSSMNCRQECIDAIRQCRVANLSCWSPAMVTAHCEGRRDNGRWDNPPRPAGHSGFNRADSGNLTTSVDNTTFIHEVGHILNLDDEYQDATYPFLPQGEDDSMMNSSTPTSRLYPRHFQKILEPARCQRVGPYAETGAAP